MIHIKYCKECKKAFDIDTSQELCPECRCPECRNKKEEKEGEEK